MAPPGGFRYDLDDPNVILIGNQFFYYNSTENTCIPLRDSIVDATHYVDQPADASIGQQFNVEPASASESQYSYISDLAGSPSGHHTTTFPSQEPSQTDPTSVSDPSSAADLGAQRRFSNDEQPPVDSSQSHDCLLKDVGQRFAPEGEYPPVLPANLEASDYDKAKNQAPSSSTVRPDPNSQRALVQGGACIPSQEVDTTLDLPDFEENFMYLLAQNPSAERLLHTRKRLGIALGQVDAYLKAFRNEEMPPPSFFDEPGDNEDKEIDRALPYYKCPVCGFEASLKHKHVFKRHVDSMHYPQYEYYCHHEDGHCTFLREPPRRRDKIREHYHVRHERVPPGNVINQRRVELPCEPFCVLCTESVRNWAEFYACFLKHCLVEPASSNVGSSHRDGNDRATKKRKHDGSDRDTFGGGAGAGGPTSSQQGHGHTGNATGQGQHHFTSGPSSNQVSNGDSRPLLQERSASDGPAGKTKGSQAKTTRPTKSKVQPLGSGGGSGSNTKAPSNKKGGQPPLDRLDLQDHAPSQPPVGECQYCQHVFNNCTECYNTPPSVNGCHECTHRKGARPMQVRHPQANRASGNSPINSQAMGFPHRAQFNPQGFHGAGLTMPMMPRANSAYAAMQQQLLRERAQAQGMAPSANTPQGFFGDSSSYMVNAVHGVQVRGMSELEIETSIMDSKSNLAPKKTQCSDIWSVVLPFRGSLSSLRKPLLGMTSIPASGTITRQFIGPVPLSKANTSSMCQCSCRTRSQETYFARGRMDIAGGRRIELDFKMAPEARGTGHPLRTRIQVVVKMLRLRSSATRSASAKHKQEAHAAIKEALEATLDGSETTSITYEDEAKVFDLEQPDYDSDAESVTESILSSCSRDSSCTNFTHLSSLPASPPALTLSRTSSCSDFTLPSPHASPELSACPKQSPCTDLKLPAATRASSPFPQHWSDDTPSSEEHLVHDVEIFEEEEKELELTFDLDLKSSLDMLARWTGVPTDDLRSSITVWDPDRVFRYIMNHLLFVIFSLARSQNNDLNPCWDRKRPSQS